MQITNLAVKIRPEVEVCRKGYTTPFKVIQGQRYWYQWKADIRLPISDQY